MPQCPREEYTLFDIHMDSAVIPALSTMMMDKSKPMLPAEVCLMERIVEFFEIPENSNTLVGILTRRHPVSLRALDRFVTRYSKTHRQEVSDATGNPIDLYTAYKAALKGYHKTYFDPYARTPAVQYPVCEESRGMTGSPVIRTTLAQLNFIRWAIRIGAVKLCETHIASGSFACSP